MENNDVYQEYIEHKEVVERATELVMKDFINSKSARKIFYEKSEFFSELPNEIKDKIEEHVFFLCLNNLKSSFNKNNKALSPAIETLKKANDLFDKAVIFERDKKFAKEINSLRGNEEKLACFRIASQIGKHLQDVDRVYRDLQRNLNYLTYLKGYYEQLAHRA